MEENSHKSLLTAFAKKQVKEVVVTSEPKQPWARKLTEEEIDNEYGLCCLCMCIWDKLVPLDINYKNDQVCI